MALPNYNTKILELSLMQSNWATQIQPVLDQPINKGNLLQNIELVIGSNKVNHKLGRKLIGWFITRKDGSADIYDQQLTNQQPNLTLSLVSDTAVMVDLYVF